MADKDNQGNQALAKALDDSDVTSAVESFRSKIDHGLAAALNSCVHCGLCAETCHYYLASGEPEMQPSWKVRLLQSVYRSNLTGTGTLLPALTGAQRLDRTMIQRWIDT